MVLGLHQKPGSIHISILRLSLLFVTVPWDTLPQANSATRFGKKQGDFGILTPCMMKDGRLRMDCFYPPCDDNTPFQCDFENGAGDLLGSSTQYTDRIDTVFSRTNMVCHLIVNGNWSTLDKPINYTCTLTRRKRKEVKEFPEKHREGKEMPKPCPSAAPLLHEASGFLWAMAIPTTLKILF